MTSPQTPDKNCQHSTKKKADDRLVIGLSTSNKKKRKHFVMPYLVAKFDEYHVLVRSCISQNLNVLNCFSRRRKENLLLTL